MPKNISPYHKGLGRLFDSSSAYVIEFFIENKGDFSREEVSKNCKVSVKALQYIIPRLESDDIIFNTRSIGKIKMYKLADNKRVEGLIKTHFNLVLHEEDPS